MNLYKDSDAYQEAQRDAAPDDPVDTMSACMPYDVASFLTQLADVTDPNHLVRYYVVMKAKELVKRYS